jgi:hypothetical protein
MQNMGTQTLVLDEVNPSAMSNINKKTSSLSDNQPAMTTSELNKSQMILDTKFGQLHNFPLSARVR